MSLDITIQAILSLSTADFTAALARARAQLDAATGSFAGLTAKAADLANGVLKTEAALAALGTALAAVAVNEASKFADSLYLVQKQLGDSGVSIQQAQDDIEGLAVKYGLNANEVAKSVAGFLAAGYDYENAAKSVNNATQLMIAGELDAQFATDALTKSIAGFRIPLEEAGAASLKIGDILNKVGDISSGKFEEIVQGFSRLSPTAKDAGWSMEETASKVAVLVDIFGSGEIAATALQSGLLSLMVPSKDAAAALADLGVKTVDASGQQRQSKAIMDDLAGTWQRLGEAQRQQTAATIFGKEQAGTMSALLGDWAKSQDYLTQIMDKTTGAAGSMAHEVEGKLKLLSNAAAAARESWRQMLVQMGAKIIGDGELGGMVQSVAKVGAALKTAMGNGALDPLFANLRAKFAALETTLNAVAQSLPAALQGIDWSGLTGSLDQLTQNAQALFRDFFGDIDITSVEGLQRAIQMVAGSMETLTRITAGILNEFRPLATAAGEAVRQFNALDESSKMDLGATLGIGKIINDLGALGIALVGLGRAGVDVAAVIGRAFAGVKVVINGLQVTFDSVVLGILSIGKMALEAARGMEAINAKMAWSDAGKQQALNAVAEYDQKLAELQLTMDGVASNWVRNWEEMKQAAAVAAGETGASTQRMREGLDQTEASLKRLGTTTQQTAATQQDAAGKSAALIQAEQALTAATERYRAALQASVNGSTDASASIATLGAEMAAAKANVDALRQGQQASADAAKQSGDAQQKAATDTGALAQAQQAAREALSAYVQAQKTGAANADQLGRAWQAAEAKVKALGGGVNATTQALKASEEATKKTAKASDDAAQAADSQTASMTKGEQMMAAFRAENAKQAEAAKQHNAEVAASWDETNKKLITYGEWVKKSGAEAEAARTKQSALATEVGNAGDRVRELGQALQDASRGVGTSGVIDSDEVADLAREFEDAKAKYAALKQELDQSAPKVEVETDTTQIDAAKVKVQELDGVKTYSDHTIETNASEALADINQLAGHDTSSTHTIYVRKVETNALGGLVGLAQRFASGGAVPGFPIPRWSTVPGSGNEDSVPASLQPGSFVLRQAASRYYGSSLLDLIARFAHGGRVPSLLMPGERLFQPATVNRLGGGFFDALNRMALPREQILAALGGLTAPVSRFAAGGAVGPALNGAGPHAAGDTVNINLTLAGQTVKLQGAREQAQALASALKALQRGA